MRYVNRVPEELWKNNLCKLCGMFFRGADQKNRHVRMCSFFAEFLILEPNMAGFLFVPVKTHRKSDCLTSP